MYQTGDIVIYGAQGICRVEAVGPLKMNLGSPDALYYTLRSYYQPELVIYAPVGGTAIVIRDPLTRALGLLVVWWSVDTAVWEVGGIAVSAGLFWGVGHRGGGVLAVPQCRPLRRHWGSSAYSGGGLRHIAAARGSARSYCRP